MDVHEAARKIARATDIIYLLPDEVRRVKIKP